MDASRNYFCKEKRNDGFFHVNFYGFRNGECGFFNMFTSCVPIALMDDTTASSIFVPERISGMAVIPLDLSSTFFWAIQKWFSLTQAFRIYNI